MRDKPRSRGFAASQPQEPEPAHPTHYSEQTPPELRRLLDEYRDAIIRYANWHPVPRGGPEAMAVAVKIDADTRDAYLALVALYGDRR